MDEQYHEGEWVKRAVNLFYESNPCNESTNIQIMEIYTDDNCTAVG